MRTTRPDSVTPDRRRRSPTIGPAGRESLYIAQLSHGHVVWFWRW